MTILSITLLGTFAVRRDGVLLTRFRSDKVRALLAYLATEADRAHTRSSLAALFWPDQSEEPALKNLSQTLARLREAIGDAQAEPPFLLATRRSVQWNPNSSTQIDIATFTRLAQSTALADLEAAADRYAGSFLHGFYLPDCQEYDEWTTVTREQTERLALHVFDTLTASYLAAHDYGAAEAAARRQLVIDPWREAAHRQVMEALAGTGQRTAALAQYAVCTRTLAEELGVAPDAVTTALYESILDGTWQPTPMPVSVQPRGAPRTVRGKSSPTAVPSPLTPMLGRSVELAQIRDLLGTGVERLVTVVGPGGIGKTRLALAAAWQLSEQHAPVWWIPLAGIGGQRSPGEYSADEVTAQLATTIAETMTIALTGNGSVASQVIDALRDRTVLLVLDNMEHLLGPDGTPPPLILDILQNTEGVQLLVTSRERVNVEAEYVLALGGLQVPPTDTDPSATNASSVQLFMSRAARAAPTLKIPIDDLRSVVRVCRLLEGMPLGIELAAHWVAHFTVTEIADAIATNLAFLTTTDRAFPDRHRSLHAVFSYSWGLLPRAEQQALTRLSVFHGGFSREAAQKVAETSVMVLAALVNKSLVRQTEVGQYALHPLLRQFAAQHLPADEAPSLRDRHCMYYLQQVIAHAPQLIGRSPQDVVRAIQRELDNIRAAWHWAVREAKLGLMERSIDGLADYYSFTGQFAEAETMAAEALKRVQSCPVTSVPNGGLPPLVGRLLAVQLQMQAQRAKVAEAVVTGQQLHTYGAGSIDHRSAARAHVWLGYVLWNQQRFAEASQVLDQAVVDAHAAGAHDFEVQALRQRGRVAYSQGEYAEALHYHERSLQLARTAGYVEGEFAALCHLGIVTREQDAFDRANAFFDQSLRLIRTLGNPQGQSYVLIYFGMTERDRGHYANGTAHHREALELYQSIGDREGVVMALVQLAIDADRVGQYDRAHQFFEQAMPLYQEYRGQHLESFLTYRGLLAHHMGQNESAVDYARRSLASMQADGDRRSEVSALTVLGHALLDLEQRGAAYNTYTQAVALAYELKRERLAIEPLAGLARTALALGNVNQALEYVGTIRDWLQSQTVEGMDEPMRIYLTCYQVLNAAGDEDAKSILHAAYTMLNEWSQKLDVAEQRHAYLYDIAAHREIVRTWKVLSRSQQPNVTV